MKSVDETISELFAKLFGSREGAAEIMSDLDGALAEAGLTDAPISGAQLQAGLRTACGMADVPAEIRSSLGAQPVTQVASATVGAAPAAPVLPPPPAAPTYPEVREYITQVNNQYYSDDDVTIIHDNSTTSNVDNSIDIDVDVEGGAGHHYDEYGNPVPVVDIDIDQDNDTQTNSGDGAVLAGGDVSNVNTGERGVVNDADDFVLDLGGRPGGPVLNGGGVIRDPGFPPFGSGAGGDDTIINTGDNSSQVGDDNFGNVESGAGDLNDVDAYNSNVAVDESAAAQDNSRELEVELDLGGSEPDYAPEYTPEYSSAEFTQVVAEVPEATAALEEIDA